MYIKGSEQSEIFTFWNDFHIEKYIEYMKYTLYMLIIKALISDGIERARRYQ